MTHIKSFDIQRILLLMQRELFENLKIVLMGFISFFGMAAVIVILNLITGGEAWKNFSGFYTFGLFLTGIFISGMAFRAFRTKEGTMSYLMVPASVLEKLISVILLTTLGVIIFYTFTFAVFDSLFVLAGNAVSDSQIGYFRFFGPDTAHEILLYAIIQSVFLAGAATFRKVPLFFTIFWLVVFSLGIFAYMVSLGFMFKESLEAAGEGINHYNGNINLMDFQSDYWLAKLSKFIFYYALAPIFWAISYFKIKEKEA